MASVSRINGLRPVKYMNGQPYFGQANVYFVPSSTSDVIMVGDVVKLAGDGRSPTGVPTVARHAGGATEAAVGVVVGILFSGMGDSQNVPPVTDITRCIVVHLPTVICLLLMTRVWCLKAKRLVLLWLPPMLVLTVSRMWQQAIPRRVPLV